MTNLEMDRHPQRVGSNMHFRSMALGWPLGFQEYLFIYLYSDQDGTYYFVDPETKEILAKK